MKSNGMEYRILKNGTGEKFKVEVKTTPFMGVERWTPLYDHYFYGWGSSYFYGWRSSYHEYNNKYIDDRRTHGRTCDIAIFDTCQKAKEAAVKFSKKPLENQWAECKC